MICCCFLYFRNKWDNTLYLYLLMRYILVSHLEDGSLGRIFSLPKKNTTTMKSFENLITFYVVSLNCFAYAKTEFVEKSFVVSFKNQPHYYSIARASWLQLMPKSCVLGSKTLNIRTRDKNIQVQRNVKNCRFLVGMVNKKLCIHHLRFLFINIFYWNALKSMS